MKKLLFIIAICFFVVISCVNTGQKDTEVIDTEASSELLSQAQIFFRAISSLDITPPDTSMVKLGKYLYFDTRLSGEGNISCNSCHSLSNFGVDNEQFSLGDDNLSRGGRNSPTVFHAALHTMQFWDGRAVDVEEQAAGPILNPIEHNIKSKEELVDRLKKVDIYQQLFPQAFKSDNDPITFDNITRAIGAFERTLMPESRFDKFLEGDISALNAQEQEGLAIFISTGCITCHSGVALGGHMLQKFGVYEDYWKSTGSEKIDAGVFDVTQNDAERFFFKVPGLRNVTHTWPYFHDGSVEDLTEAVRIMGKLQRGVDLSDVEVDGVVAFLGSLSADIPDEVKRSPFEE